MLTESTKWVIGISLTLVGFFVVHLLALHRQKEAARTEAAKKLMSVVTSELSEIYPISSAWPENIDGYLRSKFPALQSAVEAYKPYAKNKAEFERAWKIHRVGEEGREIDKQVYHQYMGFQIDNEPRIVPESQLKENIDRLLSHAKT